MSLHGKMHRRLNHRGTKERERDAGSMQGAFKISSTSVLFLSLDSEGIRILLSAYEIPRSPFCRPYSFRNTKGDATCAQRLKTRILRIVESSAPPPPSLPPPPLLLLGLRESRNHSELSPPRSILRSSPLRILTPLSVLRLSSPGLKFITSCFKMSSCSESDGVLALVNSCEFYRCRL